MEPVDLARPDILTNELDFSKDKCRVEKLSREAVDATGGLTFKIAVSCW